MDINFAPADDGKTHINIYSRASTELGRYLSNFTKCELKTEDGEFCSIEGYWYWLSTKDDTLRSLHGFHAKEYGRKIAGKDWLDDEVFKDKIKKALNYKILNMPEVLFFQFINSTVPFTHYYVYGNKIVNVEEADWILEHIEKRRIESRI